MRGTVEWDIEDEVGEDAGEDASFEKTEGPLEVLP